MFTFLSGLLCRKFSSKGFWFFFICSDIHKDDISHPIHSSTDDLMSRPIGCCYASFIHETTTIGAPIPLKKRFVVLDRSNHNNDGRYPASGGFCNRFAQNERKAFSRRRCTRFADKGPIPGVAHRTLPCSFWIIKGLIIRATVELCCGALDVVLGVGEFARLPLIPREYRGCDEDHMLINGTL